MPPSHRAEPAAEPLDEKLLRAWPLPAPDHSGGKESRGTVLVVGGSAEMVGGVVLAATAALRAGAGKLQIATCASVAPLVAAQVPEARVIGLPETRAGGIAAAGAQRLAPLAKAADAVLIGPGMLDEPAASRLVQELLELQPQLPLILDAAGLELLRDAPAALASLQQPAVVTPHAGELAHLTEEPREQIEGRALAAALEAAKRYFVVMALKGAETQVVSPAGRALCHRAANAGLGTSGSGDTLSGIVAGLRARGAEPLQAAAWAVFLHARAGEELARRIGPLGFLARELLAEVPREMAKLA